MKFNQLIRNLILIIFLFPASTMAEVYQNNNDLSRRINKFKSVYNWGKIKIAYKTSTTKIDAKTLSETWKSSNKNDRKWVFKLNKWFIHCGVTAFQNSQIFDPVANCYFLYEQKNGTRIIETHLTGIAEHLETVEKSDSVLIKNAGAQIFNANSKITPPFYNPKNSKKSFQSDIIEIFESKAGPILRMKRQNSYIWIKI